MKIGRRDFCLVVALCGTAPVFGRLLASFLRTQPHGSLMPDGPPLTLTPGATEMNGVEFKIEGWHRRDDSETNRASMASRDSMIQYPAGTPTWISINQSWRAAWR